MWKRYASCQSGPWPTLTRAISLSPARGVTLHYLLCIRTHPYPVTLLLLVQAIFEINFSRMGTPTILKFSHSKPTCLWRWNRQTVSVYWILIFTYVTNTQNTPHISWGTLACTKSVNKVMRLIQYNSVLTFKLQIQFVPFKIVPLGGYTHPETLFPLFVATLVVANRNRF